MVFLGHLLCLFGVFFGFLSGLFEFLFFLLCLAVLLARFFDAAVLLKRLFVYPLAMAGVAVGHDIPGNRDEHCNNEEYECFFIFCHGDFLSVVRTRRSPAARANNTAKFGANKARIG